MKMITMNRRQFGLTAASGLLLPAAARATSYQEITWDDLVPPGIPYAEVIGEGDLDEQTDTWRPIFDENGVKLNAALDGQQIKMPGYITPLEITSDGMTEFLLVPYLGACIHVPPPPPNQLVFVNTQTPWPGDDIWDAIWIYGTLQAQLQTTDLAKIGYALTADKIEIYEW
jgi:hypothetical protein